MNLHIHLIQVNKDSTISLKFHQTIGHIVKIFDGPGIESEELHSGGNGSYVTLSFVCLLFVSVNDSGTQFVVFHYSSLPVGKVNSIKLNPGNNMTLTWPSHNNLKAAYTRQIYQTQAMEHLPVNVTVDKFRETYNKQNNFYCSKAGISVYDPYAMENKEILSYCEESISSYQPKNNALSSNESLVIIIYEFALYTRFETEINLSVSPCGSVRFDPCKFYKFCTEADLCVRGSRKQCENYIQAVSKSSNITMKVGQSADEVKFLLPSDQCVLLQLIPMEETTFGSCLKQGCPLYLSPLYIREHSGQFLIMTYSVIGSFQRKQSYYDIKDNHIKLQGQTDYVSCTTWRHNQRSQSVSENFTLKRNSYSD